MKDPDVSIIVPVFNTGEYLNACLESICDQSFKNLEIIIVDDGSEDPLTLSILETYVNRDRRVRLFRKKNGGQSSARNAGIEQARGRYVAFIDSDDVIKKTMFESLVSVAEKSGTDMVECLHKPLTHEQLRNIRLEKTPHQTNFEIVNTFEDNKFLINHISVFNRIYRRQFLIENNLKFDDLLWCEDVVFSFKSLILANYIAFVDEVNYFYLVHDKGLSHNIGPKAFHCFIAYDRIMSFLDKISLRKDFEIQVTVRLFKDVLYGLNLIREDLKHDFFLKSSEFIKKYHIEYYSKYLRRSKLKRLYLIQLGDFDRYIKYINKRKLRKYYQKKIKNFFDNYIKQHVKKI